MYVKLFQQMNLTAITEKGQVMERHVAESLSLVPFIDQLPFQEEEKHNFRIIDVGTGAGLPGILLAIAKPGNKKLFFSAFVAKILNEILGFV